MLLDTPVCDFGWPAPDFTLQDPDGTSFTMSENLGEKGLMIAFICNHCPYVKAIADRLAEDARTLMAEGVNFVAVMSNDYEDFPSDNPDNMKAFAAQHDFPFLYLVDEDQAVGRAYGAVCTPDFFGLNKDGALQYRGRLDNAGQRGGSDRVPELLNAARLIAETGKGPENQMPSMGCSIKWSQA
ncbi:MAG: thioredoxin family protein [Pseudomonadota bacterium]